MPRTAIEVITTIGGGTLVIAILSAVNPKARQLLWYMLGRVDDDRLPEPEPPTGSAGTPQRG